MSGDGIIWATAEYRPSRPAELTVTENATGIPYTVDYQHAGPAPTMRALTTTPWSPTPGCTWHEVSPGVWRISVYRHA